MGPFLGPIYVLPYIPTTLIEAYSVNFRPIDGFRWAFPTFMSRFFGVGRWVSGCVLAKLLEADLNNEDKSCQYIFAEPQITFLIFWGPI